MIIRIAIMVLFVFYCTEGSEEIPIQPFSARRRARIVRIQDELDKCSEPLIGNKRVCINTQKNNSVVK